MLMPPMPQEPAAAGDGDATNNATNPKAAKRTNFLMRNSFET
jgi:hypothetical protein